MGKMTEKLRREFKRELGTKMIPLAAVQRGEHNAQSFPGVVDLIKEGHHPLHAIYSNVTNLISK